MASLWKKKKKSDPELTQHHEKYSVRCTESLRVLRLDWARAAPCMGARAHLKRRLQCPGSTCICAHCTAHILRSGSARWDTALLPSALPLFRGKASACKPSTGHLPFAGCSGPALPIALWGLTLVSWLPWLTFQPASQDVFRTPAPYSGIKMHSHFTQACSPPKLLFTGFISA